MHRKIKIILTSLFFASPLSLFALSLTEFEDFQNETRAKLEQAQRKKKKISRKIDEANGESEKNLRNKYGELVAATNKLEFEVEKMSEVSAYQRDEVVERVDNLTDNIDSIIDDILENN